MSSAVMTQRFEPRDSLDFFPTPPWATRALCEYVAPIAGDLVWDPACGHGHMVRPLGEYAAAVAASDVHDYGWGHGVFDFLWPTYPDGWGAAEWVVTNPPFRLARQFIERGLEVAEIGVAVLVRTTFLEGADRFRSLFQPRPPAIIAQFAERVPMIKGRLDPKASSATAYAWMVWVSNPEFQDATRMRWIPPCRKRLERPEDYAEMTP